MAGPSPSTSLWLSRALFVSLALFSMLISMMPLGLTADALPMPDLVFALAFDGSGRLRRAGALIFITSGVEDDDKPLFQPRTRYGR